MTDKDEMRMRLPIEKNAIPMSELRDRILITPDFLVRHLRDWTENGWHEDIVERLIPHIEDKARRAKGEAGARVLHAAARARESIVAGEADKAAAYCSLMIVEALMGGYVLEAEEKDVEAEEKGLELFERKWTDEQRYQNGVGKINAKHGETRMAAIAHANRIWEKDNGPTCARLGEVADSFLLDLKRTSGHLPTKKTVLDWLKDAGKKGELAIPAGASRPGAQKRN